MKRADKTCVSGRFRSNRLFGKGVRTRRSPLTHRHGVAPRRTAQRKVKSEERQGFIGDTYISNFDPD